MRVRDRRGTGIAEQPLLIRFRTTELRARERWRNTTSEENAT
jgi:hypothetical protein